MFIGDIRGLSLSHGHKFFSMSEAKDIAHSDLEHGKAAAVLHEHHKSMIGGILSKFIPGHAAHHTALAKHYKSVADLLGTTHEHADKRAKHIASTWSKSDSSTWKG